MLVAIPAAPGNGAWRRFGEASRSANVSWPAPAVEAAPAAPKGRRIRRLRNTAGGYDLRHLANTIVQLRAVLSERYSMAFDVAIILRDLHREVDPH